MIRLEAMYELLKLKAENFMKAGDIAQYLKTLARMNEIKVSLATA